MKAQVQVFLILLGAIVLLYSTEGANFHLYLPFDHYLSNQVFLIAVGVILLLCGFVTAVIILVIRRRRKRQR